MFAEMLGTEKIPVLLIEDSQAEAVTTQRGLHAIDDEFAVCRVSRLEDAFREIERDKVDVVILDLGLPDSHGPISISRLAERYPALPIVVLSGHGDQATINRALEYGAQEFLVKGECSPVMIRQALLSAIIRKSLQH